MQRVKRLHSLLATLAPEQQNAIAAIQAATQATNMPAYLVGGAIRDWFLGVPAISDLDFVVEGDAIAFAQHLEQHRGGTTIAHERFRTATWQLDGYAVDITTARRETYARPAALPTVEPSDIVTDLRRRDYTINAMALRLSDETLLDPFDGRADMDRQLLRTLHPRSFIDDPTRIFRGARYATRLSFAFEPETYDAIAPALRFLKSLSGERVKYDLELIFEEARPELALSWLLEHRIFRAMDIPIVSQEQLHQRFERMRAVLAQGEWPLASLEVSGTALTHALGWGALIYNAGMLGITRLGERMPFLIPVREALFSLGPLSTLSSEYFQPDHAVSEQSNLLRPFNGLALLITHLFAPDPQKREAMLSEWREWRWVRPTITGEGLKQLGVPPGPIYRRVLDRLRNAWLDKEVDSPESELALLTQLLKTPDLIK